MRKHLYLNLAGYKRTAALMKPFDKEIVPGFETIRGLNMVDASQLHSINTQLGTPAEAFNATGD